MLKERFLQALAIGLLALFWGVAYLEWFGLDSMSAYAVYVFEILFALGVTLFYRPVDWQKAPFSFGAAVAVFFALASGFAIYEFASILGHTVPFQMRDPETVVFLLLVAPLLEEWLFRGALWRLIERVTRNEWLAFGITSAAFAYSHYQVIGALPENFHGFVHYQAMYTFGLALFCGGMRIHVGLVGAMATHLAFNFGFWLGSL